jgi:hypothetical protein
MAQLFSRAASVRLNVALLIVFVALPVIASFGWWALYNSPLRTRRDIPIEQPIFFSHKHHAGQLGIDCRYCHVTVETSAFAGIPPIHTCMSCHSQVWRTAAMLEPVRAAWRTGIVLPWIRVNNLPQFTVFDHSIHVNRGVGCATCHGRVDQMDVVARAVTFDMRWCLKCHRQVARDDSQMKHLTDCVTCHR